MSVPIAVTSIATAADKKRKLEEGDNDEARRQRLRSNEADLKVILRGRGDLGVEGSKGETNEFWHIRQILASQNRYVVDALPSAPLATLVVTSSNQ